MVQGTTEESILTAGSLPDRAILAALSGLSPATCRVYKSRVYRWIAWSNGSPLTRESVKSWIRSQELSGASAQVRNQSLAALKKLAFELSELGWLDEQESARISRLKSKRITGIRTGRWLTIDQVKSLLVLVDRSTATGRRDCAVLALLIGCGLRRSEICDLTVSQIVREHDRTIIMNLTGKGGRVRSIAVPQWVTVVVNEWLKDITTNGNDDENSGKLQHSR